MGSDGRAFGLSDVQQTRMARAEQRRARYQRRMARCAKAKVGGKTRVSQGYLKLKRRAAKQTAYCRNVRVDVAHKASHELVESDHEVFAFEDLNIKNMTAAPAPKPDAAGRWARNGSAARAGLNAAILRSGWGLFQRFTAYKARKRNKLVYLLAPAYSSQTCAACGHRHADNRQNQAWFACVACGHTGNADANAAQVLKQWTVKKLRAGEAPARQAVKRVAFVKKRNEALLERELLEVTSESGACQPSPGAQASNAASLRCPA